MTGFQSPLDSLSRLEKPAPPKKKPFSAPKRLALEALLVISIAFPLAMGLHTFVTQVYAISGHSMEPTLHDGERVVVDKIQPALRELERGDLVIFESPEDPAKNLIKRIIAIEGDRVELIGDQVLLNGVPQSEDYIHRTLFPDRPGEVTVVKPGHFFMLGDNRPQSRDSRQFGIIPARLIRGKVLMRLWPIDEFTIF
ncbi:MAG: signal peptidase I [Planctomycetota bacterium]